MKKSNRLLVKGMALLLAVLMVLALVPVVFAASNENTIQNTDYFDLSYSTMSDVPEVILTLNADMLAAVLDDNHISKAEVEHFIPDVLLDAYRNKSIPSLDELFALIPDGALTSAEVAKLLPGQLIREKYFSVSLVEQLLGADVLKNTLKDVLNAHPEIVDALLTPENIATIKAAKIFTEAELKDLATGYDGDPAKVTEDVLFDWILAHKRSELVSALLKKLDTVINILTPDVVFTAIDEDLIIDALGGFDGIYNKADKAVLKTTIIEDLKTMIASQHLTEVSISNMYGDTAKVYTTTDGFMIAHAQAAADFVMKSVPKMETLVNASKNSPIFSIRADASFCTKETSGFSFVVKLSGDTARVNAYAAKLSNMVEYHYDNGTFFASVSDVAKDATVVFSKVITKALETTRLTVEEKREFLEIYNKKGMDLLNAIKALDFTKWLDEPEAGYMNTLKDKCIELVDRLMEVDDRFCFADYYTENGVISVTPIIQLPTDPIYEKICEKLGFDKNSLPITVEPSVVDISLDATITMKDVYEIKFVSDKGDMVFRTIMPVGTNLSEVIALIGSSVGVEAPKGWTLDGVVVDKDTTMPNKDIVLKVNTGDKPVITTYTVKFMADGKLVATLTYKEGDTVLANVPRVPNKPGYAGRWQQYKLGSYNLVVNAIYTAKTYTIRFDANGGVGTMPVQIAVYDRNTALTPCVFTRDGYSFKGWNTAADGSGKAFADKEVVKNLINVNGTTLYAQWEEVKANVYTVTFMANGSVVEKVTYEEGATALSKVPAVPARAGYTGAWESYTLSNSNITVNAVYTANTYTVAFNANGGTGTMDSITMTYDQAAKLPASTFTYTGYTFAGWNTAADGKGTSYAANADVKNLAENGEVTLYAQWNEAPVESSTVETTTAPEAEGGANVGLIVAIVVVAVAVIGGGIAFFVMKKKH